jgi:hypothetical protein
MEVGQVVDDALGRLARTLGIGDADQRGRTLAATRDVLDRCGYVNVTVTSYRYGRLLVEAGGTDAVKLRYDRDRIIEAIVAAGGQVDTLTVNVRR